MMEIVKERFCRLISRESLAISKLRRQKRTQVFLVFTTIPFILSGIAIHDLYNNSATMIFDIIINSIFITYIFYILRYMLNYDVIVDNERLLLANSSINRRNGSELKIRMLFFLSAMAYLLYLSVIMKSSYRPMLVSCIWIFISPACSILYLLYLIYGKRKWVQVNFADISRIQRWTFHLIIIFKNGEKISFNLMGFIFLDDLKKHSGLGSIEEEEFQYE